MEAKKHISAVFFLFCMMSLAITGALVFSKQGNVTSPFETPFDLATEQIPYASDTLNELFVTNDSDIVASIAMKDDLSEYAAKLVAGGPPPDGIPPIDEPKFVSVTEANDFLEPDDYVFVVQNNEEVKMYPQQVMVWHEVANDTIGGEAVAVTYSPLSGSAVAFKANLGNSGKLLNSNDVYYDRDTGSLWPQLLGKAIAGKRRGESLETVSLTWMRWDQARDAYPSAPVLSRETGFDKSYGFDPYGSYTATDSYYQTGDSFFPLMNEDERLPQKEIVRAYFVDGEPVAVPKNLDDGTQDFTANADSVFKPIEVMWFAWAAFYPDTTIVQE